MTSVQQPSSGRDRLFTYRRKLLRIIVIVFFGGVGYIGLTLTHAASFAVAIEAENGTLGGNATQVSDASASGSAAVKFGDVASCAVSGATGGTQSTTYAVGAPVSGDNTAAIQDVINAAAAAGGGTVTLQAGTYSVDGHIVLKSNVTLEGAGMFSTILQAGPQFMSTMDDGGYPVIATDGASNVTIESLEANQDADGLSSVGAVNENTSGRLSAYVVDVVNSNNVIVQHVAVRDQFTYSLVANASTNFCFRYNNVEQNPAVNGKFDQLDGIHILDSAYGDVLDNYVDQRYDGATDGDDGLVAHTLQGSTENDITFAGNVVRGGSNGNDMQLAPGGEISNIKIENNEFYGGPFGIRTGIYESGSNDVANITITGNNIHNNQPGSAYPDGGEAIDVGGIEAGGGLKSATGVVVENNEQCQATDNGSDGPFYVLSGTSNVVANNTTYTGCSDAPGSNPASN